MIYKYKSGAKQTIDTINHLRNNGINKIGVLIRHSERFFSEISAHEPFMGLTQDGKDFALEFGAALPPDLQPQLYSSLLGRCIETAYLIDKGYAKEHQCFPDNNFIEETLSPFYVKDMAKTVPLIEKHGHNPFLRNWFDKCIDENIMEDPEKTSDILCDFMVDKIKSLDKGKVAVCVSHDWNIYPIKEFKLDLKLEKAGDVNYLDGMVFFQKEDQYFLTSHQADPVLLPI